MSHVEIYVTPPGEYASPGWRWRLIKNGRLMARSGHAYSRLGDCLNGCATVLGGWTFLDHKGATVVERMNRRGDYDHLPVRDLTKVKP